jgi:hypothetical protein
LSGTIAKRHNLTGTCVVPKQSPLCGIEDVGFIRPLRRGKPPHRLPAIESELGDSKPELCAGLLGLVVLSSTWGFAEAGTEMFGGMFVDSIVK